MLPLAARRPSIIITPFLLRVVSSYMAYLFTYLVANIVEQIHTSCLCVVGVEGTALSPLCLSLHLCLAPNPNLGD